MTRIFTPTSRYARLGGCRASGYFRGRYRSGRPALRCIAISFAYLFLGVCALMGAAVFWYLPAPMPFWAELGVAAAAGLAAGGAAPRALAIPLAWLALVAPAWLAFALAAGAGLLQPAALPYVVYPLAASAGGAAGLAAWRLRRPRRGWRIAPVAACALVVAGLVYLAAPLARWGASPPYRAPAFSLELLGGGRLASTDFRGKTVVLAFWATWCEPCREELPRLQALSGRYRGDPHVVFYLVDVGTAGETRAKARAFLERYAIAIPSAYDPGGKVAMKFRARGMLPVRLVIDPQGTVRYESFGYAGDEADLRGLQRTIAAALKRA